MLGIWVSIQVRFLKSSINFLNADLPPDLPEEELLHRKYVQEIAQTTTYEDLTVEQAKLLKEELEEYRLKKKVGYYKMVSGQAANVWGSMERCREEVS